MLTHNVLDAMVLKYEGHCTLDQKSVVRIKNVQAITNVFHL